ncbi:hypothetical protein ATO6_18290 [Oceanicola sp. 22II-s10i]|uniref:hypothetical protein n=1 Tax=Oceanicola sp. 22II-s10i TaxID=1317116 RepID=UPI000B72EC25|nr:hypothetical protein [Oceanicola sp. 22II-s10i]OWU83508.1 hypothetical protein ATO6_18290 [Oceanicola sp. 22II-s10i]
MFGVVLWSDRRDDRAVIWCEDHGDLAYFNAREDALDATPELDPGDLVQFDVTETGRLRRARNPRLVAEDQYPTLAGDLKTLRQGPGIRTEPTPQPESPRAERAIVLPFSGRTGRSRVGVARGRRTGS